MPRRFQFSLGRLIGSLSLVCLALGLWRQSFSDRDLGLPPFNPFAFTGFVMAAAAGIGILFRRAVDFVFAVYLGCVALALVAALKLL